MTLFIRILSTFSLFLITALIIPSYCEERGYNKQTKEISKALQKKDWQKAKEEISDLIFQKEVSISDRARAEFFLQLIRIELDEGEFQKADFHLDLFKLTVKDGSFADDVLFLEIELLFTQKEVKKAYLSLREIENKIPPAKWGKDQRFLKERVYFEQDTIYETILKKASYHFEKQEFTKALLLYEETLSAIDEKLYPAALENPLIHSNCQFFAAKSAQMANLNEKAFGYFYDLFERNDDQPFREMAAAELVKIYLRDENSENAKKMLQFLVDHGSKKDKKHAIYSLLLCDLFYQSGDVEKASHLGFSITKNCHSTMPSRFSYKLSRLHLLLSEKVKERSLQERHLLSAMATMQDLSQDEKEREGAFLELAKIHFHLAKFDPKAATIAQQLLKKKDHFPSKDGKAKALFLLIQYGDQKHKKRWIEELLNESYSETDSYIEVMQYLGSEALRRGQKEVLQDPKAALLSLSQAEEYLRLAKIASEKKAKFNQNIDLALQQTLELLYTLGSED